MPSIYAVGIGSSHPNSLYYLDEAIERLKKSKFLRVCSISRIRLSGGVGTKDALVFRNGAVVLESNLHPSSVWFELRRIETNLGRIRTAKNSPRTIDLDILWWSNGRYEDAWVSIPHPRFYERKFALDAAREALLAGCFTCQI